MVLALVHLQNEMWVKISQKSNLNFNLISNNTNLCDSYIINFVELKCALILHFLWFIFPYFTELWHLWICCQMSYNNSWFMACICSHISVHDMLGMVSSCVEGISYGCNNSQDCLYMTDLEEFCLGMDHILSCTVSALFSVLQYFPHPLAVDIDTGGTRTILDTSATDSWTGCSTGISSFHSNCWCRHPHSTHQIKLYLDKNLFSLFRLHILVMKKFL